MEWSVRQKVVNPDIHAAQIYNYTSMIVICGYDKAVVSELGLEMLGSGFLEVTSIRRVLGKLVLFCQSNQKVINSVA